MVLYLVCGLFNRKDTETQRVLVYSPIDSGKQ